MNDDIYKFAYLLLGSIASLEPSDHPLAKEIHDIRRKPSKVVQDGNILLYNLGNVYTHYAGVQSSFALATIDDLKNIPKCFYNAMIPPQIKDVPELTIKCTGTYASRNDLKKDEEAIELSEGLILGHNDKGLEDYLSSQGFRNPHPEYSNPNKGSFFMQSPDSVKQGIERLIHLEKNFSSELKERLRTFLDGYKHNAEDIIGRGCENKRKADLIRWHTLIAEDARKGL